jgi:hypothetical protein
LREYADRLSTESPAEINAILDAFPPGWARRRALQALFRAGAPEKHEAALTLIRELGRPTDRRWCLRTFAETRELPDDQLERLLEEWRFPLPAGREKG